MNRTKLIHAALARAAAITMLASAGLAPEAIGGNGALPPNSHAHGASLAGWEEIFWRSYFGDITVPTDANGNAVVGSVVLLNSPAAAGDGTPASIDVTLKTGQSFVLPLWVLFGTSYDDGTPPDPFEPVSIFETLEITLTIDGQTILDSSNAMNYYTQFAFDPVIPLSFPPIDALIWFQGIGLVHHPLTPGQHTFVLHAKNTQPAFGTIFEYNNTWNVTVERGK